MDRFNILIPQQLDDVDLIWSTLRGPRFEFEERDYAHFTARRKGLDVTVYEKSPKALVQGNGAGEFAQELLEPLLGC